MNINWYNTKHTIPSLHQKWNFLTFNNTGNVQEMWAWYFLYISCTYHTYSTGHSTCNISWCAEIVTFSVYFLYLSYIQYRSFDLDFLMCRNCHIFCTFPVPIIHTVQVIRPGAFPDLQKLSHFLYISCMNPILNQCRSQGTVSDE